MAEPSRFEARMVALLEGDRPRDARGRGHVSRRHHAAQIAGVRVAGKTGTASTATEGRYHASFVGIVPADAPRYVVLAR